VTSTTTHRHPSAADLDRAAADRLQRTGERYTSGRRGIVEVLARAAAPVSVPELLDLQPGLAQSSAYRNLAVLERAGVVHRITTGGDWGRFEIAEDLTDHHHHHLICATCGVVTDFTVSDELERDVTQALAQVASTYGFVAEHHRLDLVGRCTTCAERS
jgi:Fe2+ or Zn2+ uptake regulation protein